ncbi:MAG: AraC family transcriptional regulator [Variovorax sp.]
MRSGDEGSVQIGVLLGIAAQLKEMHIDPAQLLEASGLPASSFDDPEFRISYAAAGSLFERCADATGCAHFGLLAGQRVGMAALGVLGELVERSRTVQSALQSVVAHFHLRTRGGMPTFEVGATTACLGYAIYLRDAHGTAQICDFALALELNVMRALCGASWQPTEVLFAHAGPADPAPYRRFFGSRLRFNSERSGLVFARKWLDVLPPRSDAERHRRLQLQVLALAREEAGDLVDRVRRSLRTMVLNGKATEALTCGLFAVSARTLHRLLAARGTSFRRLLDEVRYEVARQLLADTDIPIGQVAASLDYADASAFVRAFRRWTDVSPAAWRLEVLARR